jgi:hypothetical protein
MKLMHMHLPLYAQNLIKCFCSGCGKIMCVNKLLQWLKYTYWGFGFSKNKEFETAINIFGCGGNLVWAAATMFGVIYCQTLATSKKY